MKDVLLKFHTFDGTVTTAPAVDRVAVIISGSDITTGFVKHEYVNEELELFVVLSNGEESYLRSENFKKGSIWAYAKEVCNFENAL